MTNPRMNFTKGWWARLDSNQRLVRYERTVLTGLNYTPLNIKT